MCVCCVCLKGGCPSADGLLASIRGSFEVPVHIVVGPRPTAVDGLSALRAKPVKKSITLPIMLQNPSQALVASDTASEVLPLNTSNTMMIAKIQRTAFPTLLTVDISDVSFQVG